MRAHSASLGCWRQNSNDTRFPLANATIEPSIEILLFAMLHSLLINQLVKCFFRADHYPPDVDNNCEIISTWFRPLVLLLSAKWIGGENVGYQAPPSVSSTGRIHRIS